MNLNKAFKELYPYKEEKRVMSINYNNRFKSLNSNVKYDNHKIVFSLSKDWLEYSEELRKGLVQSLMVKIHPYEYEETMAIDLYKKFISNLNRYAKRDKTDPILEEAFKSINKEYFEDLMEQPNLVWGKKAFYKLGHYEHQTDTVLISEIFKEEKELLDYILFHELLHKKHGIKFSKTGRHMHHTKAFRDEEKKFKDKNIEKKLKWFLRKHKLKNAFGF